MSPFFKRGLATRVPTECMGRGARLSLPPDFQPERLLVADCPLLIVRPCQDAFLSTTKSRRACAGTQRPGTQDADCQGRLRALRFPGLVMRQLEHSRFLLVVVVVNAPVPVSFRAAQKCPRSLPPGVTGDCLAHQIAHITVSTAPSRLCAVAATAAVVVAVARGESCAINQVPAHFDASFASNC